MTDKEIKELIIACIDRCDEHEIYSKDIMKEIYGYVERWTHSINKEELHKLANDEAEVYGLCFADSGEFVYRNRKSGFYDGYCVAYQTIFG